MGHRRLGDDRVKVSRARFCVRVRANRVTRVTVRIKVRLCFPDVWRPSEVGVLIDDLYVPKFITWF